MKNYRIKIKRKFLLIFLFLYLQPTFTKGEIFIGFLDDGEISYCHHRPILKRNNIQLNSKWAKIEEENNKNKECFFKVRFLKNENCYELQSWKPIPEEEDIKIRISESSSVKFVGDMFCHSLNLWKAYNKESGGNFINDGNIFFVDTDSNIKNKQIYEQNIKKYGLHINDNVIFKNNKNLNFERKTLLSLNDGILINNDLIKFNKESRIIGKNPNTLVGSLVFANDEDTSLVNNGNINGLGILGLFAKCFVSEKGNIHSNKQIVMEWDGRNTNLQFLFDIEQPIKLKPMDKNFPILEIVRILETVRLECSLDATALGEKAACDFYKNYTTKMSFSHKSNSQENGIDVIAYDENVRAQIIVHESKNHHDNSFSLGKNQMTQNWVYGYLFRMYQEFLKETSCILQTEQCRLPKSQYNHIKNVLLNILNEEYLDDLRKIIKWKNKKKISSKEKQNIIQKTNNILRKDISKMLLADYKAFFIDDLEIRPGGNSIVYCKLPTIEEHGFENNFEAPTYYIHRDLSTTFKQMGVPPKPNG